MAIIARLQTPKSQQHATTERLRATPIPFHDAYSTTFRSSMTVCLGKDGIFFMYMFMKDD